jgi:Zn-dependent protease
MIKKNSEIYDLFIAWIAISFCFAIVIGNYSLLDYVTKNFVFTWSGFLTNFGLSLIITATSFIAHEMAHKYTGIHFGAQARFVMWPPFLIFGIALAGLLGVIFIAPGAVYIYGKSHSIKEDGITSMAGPVTNLVMALLFFIAAIIGAPMLVISYGLMINLWIAFFNLIPFGPLDGAKIIRWNPLVWGILIAIPIFFMFVLGFF